MREFNIGVIGCGGIAAKAHFPNIDKIPYLHLYGVCDVDIKRAEAIKAQYNCPVATGDYKDLINDPKIDAIHICTPNFLHAPIAIEALKAKKHVLIEKPIAISVKDAKEIYKVAKENHVKVMSANCFRYQTEGTMLKKFIDGGHLGEVYFSKIQALRRRGIPPHGVFTDKSKQGGGPLIDIAIHLIDQAIYILGNPKPVSVTGATFNKIGTTLGHATGVRGPWNPADFNVEDFAFGMVRFENGHIMSIETSFAANIEKDRQNLQVLGSKGGADTQPLKVYTECEEIMTDMTPTLVPPTNFYDVEMRGFYEAIDKGEEVPIKEAEVINVLSIIEGLYKSAELGKEILL